MSIEDVFYIYGKKLLIFRKEGDSYITFSPEQLEYYKINFVGAEILYLIANKYTYNSLIDYFTKKYNLSEKSFKKDLMSFLSSFGCKDLIQNNLIELNIEVQ